MFAELLWVEPEQVVAGGNSSLVMMREVLVDLWLHGGVDSERPWGQEEKVTFICPVPGLRPALHAARLVRHRDGDRARCTTTARRRGGRPARRRRPDASRACGSCRPTPTRQRFDRHRRRSRPGSPRCRRRRPTSRSSGTTPTRSTTSPRTRPRAPTSSPWRRPRATRTGRSCSRRPRRSRSPAPGSRSWPASVENVRVVPRPPRQGRHRPRQGQPAAARRSSSAPRRACATTWSSTARSSRPKFAEVERVLTERLGGLGVATWTKPTGGYFVSLDVARRHRVARGPAGQGGRDRAHPGRLRPSPTATTPATATSGSPRPSRRSTR